MAKKKMPTFYVVVNPFEQKATIKAKIDGTDYCKKIFYESIDEWNAFNFGGKTFDVHFNYDEIFTVGIFPVVKGEIDYNNECPVKLKFKLTSDKMDDKGNWLGDVA